MHVELVVPALFHSAAAAPALELLLARGRRADAQAASLEDWLGRAFGLGEGPLPAGALSALAGGLDPGAGHWLRADPVHLRADRDRVLLIPSAGFAIAADEAQALCGALNRHFADQFSLHAFAPGPLGPVRALGHRAAARARRSKSPAATSTRNSRTSAGMRS